MPLPSLQGCIHGVSERVMLTGGLEPRAWRRVQLAARGIIQDPLATAHIPVRCSLHIGAGPVGAPSTGRKRSVPLW